MQYSLRFCLNSDKISKDSNNIYYSIYNDDEDEGGEIEDLYFQGNDISEKPLFNCFSKIKDFLEKSPSNFGAYICICDKYNLDSDVYIEFVKGNGYQMNHEK